MEILESILSQNPCYKAGRKIKVAGLMLHSVGCPQPSAEAFMKTWNSPNYGRACVHAFVDGITGRIYQTLPWDHRAWHCGGTANNTHIGVEMCEPSCIKYTGGAGLTCSDKEAAMAVLKRTYDASVELFAFLCGQFGLDPIADGVIISHNEGHDRGVASGHKDPEHLWKGLQAGYTMDGFRRDVEAAMGRKSAKIESGDCCVQEQTATADAASSGCRDIRQGDTVCIAQDAVYYTGKEMPAWVKNDRWIVKSVGGDRVVIDGNVGGTKAINSPVAAKYLTVVNMAEEQAKPDVSAMSSETRQPCAQRPSAQTQQDLASAGGAVMSVSDRGVELIARYEGCRLEAYKCPAGVWTIGYGHTAGVNPGDRLSCKEDAKALLKEDLKKYGGYVNHCAQKGVISFPLTQNQFDALTSFTYNCGNGSLQKLVSGRDAAAVAEKMLQYNKGGGKVLAGLTKRRQEERALFLS